jgi:voltage-gated potassium channel Kch
VTGQILIVGQSALAAGVEAALGVAGARARRLRQPVDRELRRALAAEIDAVVVVDRDDVHALRSALLVEYVRPGVRLIVTVFDRTVAEQMRRAIPNCHVLSMADATVGAIVGPCLDRELVAVHRAAALTGVVAGADGPRTVLLDHPGPSARQRRRQRLVAQLRPYDRTSRLLLCSMAGLVGLVVAEATITGLSHHEPIGVALYTALKATTTVGPSPVIDSSPGWLQVYGIVSMALALVLAAVFTAALTSRLMSRRLTGIVGRRTIPRVGHVVVVGLGQVGFRLCLELLALGVGVVAVERDRESRYLRMAKRRGIPVVLGDGGDRFVLEGLSLGRARALAAVTSDELANIAVSVAALAVAPAVRTVLRAGGGEVTQETRALFPVGVAQDLERIAAVALAATALGEPVEQAFLHEGRAFVQRTDGRIVPFAGAAVAAA